MCCIANCWCSVISTNRSSFEGDALLGTLIEVLAMPNTFGCCTLNFAWSKAADQSLVE